jgi:hypothetical protein
MKRLWEKPRLVILVSSKPEEAVLMICKVVEPPGSMGPNHIAAFCKNDVSGCQGCSIMVPS